MSKIGSVIFAGLIATLATFNVQATTLSLVGGTSGVTLPANFSGNPELTLTGLTAQVDQVTVFDSANSATEGLALSGTSSIRFEYLGKEAGYTNRAIELGGFGLLFDTTTSSAGDSVTVTLSPNSNGLLPFKFWTSGGGIPKEAANGDIDNPLAIAFSAITGNSIIALFGDGAGDYDFDDMAIRISVVPLPPSLILFGAALLGLGWISHRRKLS